MDVVRRSACRDERETLATRNAAQVSVELGCAGGGNQGAAILGAEDAMNEIARVRVGHGTPSLRDSHSTIAILAPTLKRGANKPCAYGADRWPACAPGRRFEAWARAFPGPKSGTWGTRLPSENGAGGAGDSEGQMHSVIPWCR